MWRVLLKLTFLLLGIVAIIPLGLVSYRLKRHDLTAKIGQYYLKYAAWVIGLRVIVKGNVITNRPLILVSNHISYLDIIALGSIHPMIFTPKAEIGSWPLIGWLCRLMGCVFIERKKQKTANNLAAIEHALDKKSPLVLFAEGTTSDSKRILPIRSSYFKIVEDHRDDVNPVAVQPIFLRYTRVHNLPIDLDSRHKIAWYGDMDLAPHASELLQLGPIEAEVRCLDKIDITNCKSRKEIAEACENALVNIFNNLH